MIPGGAHFCYNEDRWFKGGREDLRTKERLSDDYGSGTDLDEVSTYTVAACGDPAGPCWEDPNEYDYSDECAQCGECGAYHPTIGSAMDCCS